jgi:hypothetical protein
MKLSDRAANRLIIAGAMLQKSGVKITKENGQTYPQAVLNVLDKMPEAQKKELSGLVDWVEAFDQADTERK